MEESRVVKKGEVFWADLGENEGHVQSGRRPVLVLGNDTANRFSGVVTILPISGRVEKLNSIPTHIKLNSALRCECIVLPEQIRTIAKEQLVSGCIYRLTDDEQSKVDQALIKQLGLS